MQLTTLGVFVLIGLGVLIALVVGLVIKSGMKDTIDEFVKGHERTARQKIRRCGKKGFPGHVAAGL